MPKKKLLVCNAGFRAYVPFDGLFASVEKCSTIQQAEEADENTVILFEGGTDVNPKFYMEPMGNHTQSPDNRRDSFEVAVYHSARKSGASFLGICRGAQLLTVLAGGRLIQHVENHGGYHTLKTNKGEEIVGNSTHHQMMVLPKDPALFDLIAWTEGRSKHYMNGYGRDIAAVLPESPEGRVIEPEIVFYKKPKALAIQGHPEFLGREHPFVGYCRNLVQQHIL